MVGTWNCKQNPGQVLLIPTSPLSPLVFFNLYLLEPINFVPACNFFTDVVAVSVKDNQVLHPSPPNAGTSPAASDKEGSLDAFSCPGP